jgi:hypothetical protein
LKSKVHGTFGPLSDIPSDWQYRIPYELALKVCLEKCYKIRHYLAPLFGPDFVNNCNPVDELEERQAKAKPGRKPRSPPTSTKRPADHQHDVGYHDDRPSIKRRPVGPCASGTTTPPEIPFDTNVDQFHAHEVCDALSAARELMRLSQCQPDGVPRNDWPMPNDSRMGGSIIYRGQRYHWDGADQFVPELKAKHPRPQSLPSVKELVDFPSSSNYNRFPITPSPQQSPLGSSLHYDWQNNAAAQALISPPMSLRESFNGLGQERHFSIPGVDECHTPAQESYSGSLFPTPQPDNTFENRS